MTRTVMVIIKGITDYITKLKVRSKRYVRVRVQYVIEYDSRSHVRG